jgi:ribose transport system permease protein
MRTPYLRKLFTGQNSREGLWVFPLGMCLVAAAVLAARSSIFLDSTNLLNLVSQATPMILATLGQLIVVLIGGLDLSVGSVISMTTAILVLDAPLGILLAGVFAFALFVGLTNGLIIAKLNVHPIIATLSTMSIVQGMTMFIRPVAGGETPAAIVQLVSTGPFGIHMPLVWTGAAILIGWKLVHGSRFGLHLFAIGGGKEHAASFGIDTTRITVTAYVLSSLFAAAAGVFLAGRIGSGDPTVGAQFAVDSITAVALGGVQLAGGVGSVAGGLTGAGLLALLAMGMNIEQVSAYVQTGVKGLLLLAVIALQPRKNIGL